MPLGSPKVLIVDDEKEYLSDFLALFSRKFNLTTANSADEAIAIMEKEKVGVVISDQRMPRKSGSQLMAVINERWPETVRILLTGYCDMNALVEAVNKGGIFKYVTKETPLNEIEETIGQAVEKFTSEEKIRQRLKAV